MSQSPAGSGRGRRYPGTPDGTAFDGSLMAAPVAAALAEAPATSGSNGLGSLRTGGCSVWPLPLDGTCAAVARRHFRAAVAGLSLPQELVHDGVTMASELAANTLHAQQNVTPGGGSYRPVNGAPELWLYTRSQAEGCELVCKVFDSQPRWRSGMSPDPAKLILEAVNGRGLQVVAGLSEGRWGHHPTRARLGAWKVPGKAVWFAMRLPASGAARFGGHELTACEAVNALETMLADRGLGGSMVRVDEPAAQMSVLSVRRDLTVWCRGATVSWRTMAGHYERRSLADLVDVAEQIVCTHEEMDSAGGAA